MNEKEMEFLVNEIYSWARKFKGQTVSKFNIEELLKIPNKLNDLIELQSEMEGEDGKY